MLSEIQIALQIPAWVQEGLANGSLERIGSIIREKGSKTIRVWLEEGGLFTAEEPSQLLGQQMSQLAMQSNVMMGLQVANLAVSAVGFVVIYRKLQSIERRLVDISGKLETIDKNLKWFDHKDMVKQVSNIARAIQILQEYDLYKDKSTANHLLNSGLHDLHKCQIYFHQLVKEMLNNDAHFSKTEELAVCYKAWVMATTARIQILHAKDELEMALSVSNDFQASHKDFGKQLWKIQNDGYLQFSSAKDSFKALVNEAVEVNEIVRGNCLQLEYLKQPGLEIPLIDRNVLKNHDGFVAYYIEE